MFYIIGLGLSDEKDITIRGLEVRVFSLRTGPFVYCPLCKAIRSSERVYLEAYTSILMVDKTRLVCPSHQKSRFSFSDSSVKEAFYEKQLILADREMVETQSDDILANADSKNVSLLVVGDPFGYACQV